MNITLYSTHCPMCKMIETKLKQANIDFQIIDNKDEVIAFGIENGIKSAPILSIDGIAYDSKLALKWIKEYQTI